MTYVVHSGGDIETIAYKEGCKQMILCAKFPNNDIRTFGIKKNQECVYFKLSLQISRNKRI